MSDKGNVNDVFTSNDSNLKVYDDGYLYGENTIDFGDQYSQDTKCGAFSVEFCTDSQNIIFTTVLSTRIFIDEGEGYKCTNTSGLNAQMVELGGTNGIWKMSFPDKKDRDIKIELSRVATFGDLLIDKGATIKKVEREPIKKVMFISDSNAVNVFTTVTRFQSMKPMCYPYGICDGLNLSCILSTYNNDLYVKDSTGYSRYNFMESLKNNKENLNIEPDIIVFDGGVIISWGYDLKEVEEAADECYKYVKTNFPNTKIIVIGTDYREKHDKTFKEINKTVRKTALDNGCYYIDLCSGETISSTRKDNIKRKRTILNWNRLL